MAVPQLSFSALLAALFLSGFYQKINSENNGSEIIYFAFPGNKLPPVADAHMADRLGQRSF
jgi:hypothetical protein